MLAFGLVSVLDTPERSHALRFVGRERERQSLAEAWQRVQAQARCELVTVVGDAGVGKSRLVGEVAALDARVVRGRCLPYGDGITYWPVVEVVTQLAVPRPTRLQQRRSARCWVSRGSRRTQTTSPGRFRKLLESRLPLVVVVDDLQWARRRSSI